MYLRTGFVISAAIIIFILLGSMSATAADVTQVENLTISPSQTVSTSANVTGNVSLSWDEKGTNYNVYYSNNPRINKENWTKIANNITTSNFTHTGALGGEDYYIVTAVNGSSESNWSEIAFVYGKRYKVPNGQSSAIHYTSIPTGLADLSNNGTLDAEDVVLAIEGCTFGECGGNITGVVKWDYTINGFNEIYEFRQTFDSFEWEGTNFEITPGSGVGLRAESNFTWHVNATQTSPISHTYSVPKGETSAIHYTSIDTTLNDTDNDGSLHAEDIVLQIEGCTGEGCNKNISAVVKWDYTVNAFNEIFEYRQTFTGDEYQGDNFEITPGSGIGLRAESNFTWNRKEVHTD